MADKKKDSAAPDSETAQQTAEAPAAPSELEVLRARAEAAEQERDQFRALAQRTRADFENYQKRQQREQAQEKLYAVSALAGDLLPMLDNLDRALSAAKQSGESGALVQGVAMVQSQVLDALRRYGVNRMDAEGKPFDPNLHQAVMQQPTTDKPPMTVLQVLESGYTIHDRVLRPARVIVSVADAATT